MDENAKDDRVNRLVVYTALFGTIGDVVRPPLGVLQLGDVDFVCFTDRKVKLPEPWEARPAAWDNKDPRRIARYHKLRPDLVLPDYDCWMWIDACLQPRIDPRLIVSSVMTPTDMLATFKHPQRSCVYREQDACRRFGKDRFDTMRRQTDRYRFLGLPANNGLAETSCVIRRNCPEIVAFNKVWWGELSTHSVRDQLSFPFVCWSLKMPYALLPGCRDRSPHFTYFPHRRRT